MSTWMAGKIKFAAAKRNFVTQDTRILILGFSFKPDSDDIRNTKVADLYKNLVETGFKTTVYDPLVDAEKVKNEYGITLTTESAMLKKKYQVIVIGTHHKVFDKIDMESLLTDKGFVCDIYGIHNK